MNLTIIGTGYVGLVSGVCFAELGNKVVCIDKDENKIKQLQQGKNPIYEPGLEPLLQKNIEEESIQFSTSLAEHAAHSDVIMIAVGTPQAEDGSADLRFVHAVADEIGEALPDNARTVVVNKSTVPVGTAEAVEQKIRNKNPHADVAVCSVPEFLREGSAVQDTMNPDRIVIGTDLSWAADRLKRLHEPLVEEEMMIVTTARSAEMIKYAANSFLATKISFINEIANLCEIYGADIRDVARGIGTDHRISPAFLNAGLGYGGSCFPKDVRALMNMASVKDYDAKMLKATDLINQNQRKKPVEQLRQHLRGELAGLKVAVWGLAFKPNTDDMREAPSIDIIHELVKEGVHVYAHDPVAANTAAPLLPRAVEIADDIQATIQNADALILLTEWDMYKQFPIEDIHREMKGRLVIDGRNVLDTDELKKRGFDYYGIGRTNEG